MKPQERNKVVQYLLEQMTFVLMAKSPAKDHIQKTAQKHEARLRAMFTEEEFAPIGQMRDCIVALAEKLANCNDVTQLQHTHSYLQELIEGKVLIAEANETGEITGFTTNQ